MDIPLDEIRKVNPVFYNEMISLASQAASSDDPSVAIKNWKTATKQEQGMIAEQMKVQPLVTSLSNEVGKRVTGAMDIEKLIGFDTSGNPTLSTENAQKYQESLKKVEDMFSFFSNMKDDMSMHQNAIALNSIALKSNL